jgi:hypothetical protein
MAGSVSPNAVAPTTDESPWIPVARIGANTFIVIACIFALCWALDIAIHFGGKDVKASDVVAIVGAITPFLGTAIGVYFGINVGQIGKGQATNAAAQANAAAMQANRVASQANDAAEQRGIELSSLKGVLGVHKQAIDSLVNMMPTTERQAAQNAVSEIIASGQSQNHL